MISQLEPGVWQESGLVPSQPSICGTATDLHEDEGVEHQGVDVLLNIGDVCLILAAGLVVQLLERLEAGAVSSVRLALAEVAWVVAGLVQVAQQAAPCIEPVERAERGLICGTTPRYQPVRTEPSLHLSKARFPSKASKTLALKYTLPRSLLHATFRCNLL